MNVAGAAVLILFAAMLVLPFVPGLLEIRRPRDRYPLLVDLDYAKDPRHFGRRLRHLLRAGIGPGAAAAGTRHVQMSRLDRVEVTGARSLSADSVCDAVLLVQGDLKADTGCRLHEDAYVVGAATLAARCDLRTLACDGDLRLGAASRVHRWLDADGEIWAGEGADLGAYCATAKTLHLADGVRFSRLFAEPIITVGAPPAPVADLPSELPPLPRPSRAGDDVGASIADVLSWHAGDLDLAPGSRYAGDAVVRGHFRIGCGALLRGRVRVHKSCRLDAGAVLDGDLYADGDVTLGTGVVVTGTVFAQGRVDVGSSCRIGRPGAVKSVVGNLGVTLGASVLVHGQVHAEGEGIVACRGRS